METKTNARHRKKLATKQMEQPIIMPCKKYRRRPSLCVMFVVMAAVVYLVRGQSDNVIMSAVHGFMAIAATWAVAYFGNGKNKQ